MDDLYFIPKCIKPKFERQPDGTPVRMFGYSYSPAPGASSYPSMVHTGTDYFKALKRISKLEAEKIQEFLMRKDDEESKTYYDPITRQWLPVGCDSFEIAVQQWPKAPKIDAVYFLTHGIRIQLINNDKVSECTDIQVQEEDKIFKSYLYSILQLIFDKPYTLIQDALHGQFLMFQFIRKIIFSDCATIIIWDDGSKTVSKCLPSDTYDAETGVLLCILKKFYKPSHLNKMFKRAMALKYESEQIKKENQSPICPYCKTHTMMLRYKFRTCALPSEVFYECSKCHSRSPKKLTALDAEKAAMSIE